MTERYTSLSLFTGACGLDAGLEETKRFDLRGCLELDPVFCETIRENRDAGRIGTPATQVMEGDIRSPEYAPEKVRRALRLRRGELDLLVGGPPCQPFSCAGRRQSINDDRGSLIWYFLDYVEAFRPSFFIMENVRGLLSAALLHRPIALRPDKGGPLLTPEEVPGSVIESWVAELQRRTNGDYHIDCFEVNAVNYGAPQLRERVFIVGNRLGHVVDFPNPTHAPPEVIASGASALLPYRTLRDALEGLVDPDPVLLDFSPRKKRYLSMVPPGGNWRALPVNVQRESMGKAWGAKGGRSGWWRRLSWDLPCPTLTTMPNHAQTSMCHPSELRVLSLAEYAAIQEFPPDWHFAGTVQKRYEQAGNAVPVRLGRVAGDTVANYLQHGKQRPPRGVDPFRRVYIKSHVRTRKWFKAGETYVWDDGAENDSMRYYC